MLKSQRLFYLLEHSSRHKPHYDNDTVSIVDPSKHSAHSQVSSPPFSVNPKMLARCFRRATQTDDLDIDLDLDPVLLVSGIGGSILHSKSKKSGFQTRVWVRILLADLEFKKRIWSLYNPQTGYTEALDKDTEIVVPDDDYGLYAIDILDPSKIVTCLHLSEVYQFHDMIDMLVGCGYKKGKSLFGFGYDFRQSNRTEKSMEGLRERLETAYKASGGRKVNIISHSMGGLLVSCFVALHNAEFTKYVNKWICIACPFQGAPGCINDSLLTGLQFIEGFESYFFVQRWTMHQLLVECPSIYEMLPNPAFNWKKQPQIYVWRKTEDDSIQMDSYGPTESINLFEETLKDNKLDFEKKSIPLPFNLSILDWATKTRQILDSAQLLEGVSFYNIYGTSFDTPFDVSYGSKTSPVQKTSDICHTVPQYSFVDGDGTVPAESAKADGYKATARVGVAASHRGLLSDEAVFQLIKKWLVVGNDAKSVQHHPKTASRVMNIPIS